MKNIRVRFTTYIKRKKESLSEWKHAFKTYEMSDVTRGMTYGFVSAWFLFIVLTQLTTVTVISYSIGLITITVLEILGKIYQHKRGY